jgi:hypothetical protein
MRLTHTHPCVNAPAGCPHVFVCDDQVLSATDSAPTAVCAYESLYARLECEACADARCPSCRALTHLEPHDRACLLQRLFA